MNIENCLNDTLLTLDELLSASPGKVFDSDIIQHPRMQTYNKQEILDCLKELSRRGEVVYTTVRVMGGPEQLSLKKEDAITFSGRKHLEDLENSADFQG